MKINRTISSADATRGENVDFSTLDDVMLGSTIVIPKGSTAIATVTEAQSKRNMGRGGKLGVNIDYVRMQNGEKLPLRGVQDMKAGGHVGAMTGAMVATSIVFFPAAPLFLFMKGKDITIPEGHEVTVYTNTEYQIGSSNAATLSNAVAVPQLTAPALTDEDVLKLKSAGLGDDLIVAKITSSPGNYKLSTDDLLRLKQAGLSDQVLTAMMHSNSPIK